MILHKDYLAWFCEINILQSSKHSQTKKIMIVFLVVTGSFVCGCNKDNEHLLKKIDFFATGCQVLNNFIVQ